MRGRILAIIFLINFTSFLSLNAQWARTYGGSEDECAYSIQQTSDGGYIVAGETRSFGAGTVDSWILKLSSVGDIEWQKTYGLGWGEEAYSIQQTNGGRYIVGGSKALGGWEIWVLKLSSNGGIEWQKSYDGGYRIDKAYSIQQTSDGGYIVAGKTGDTIYVLDIWVLKLSSDGTIEWQKTYGGSQSEEAFSIQQTNDGGYLVAGYTESFGAGNGDIWVLKLSSDGTIEWQKTYGGTQSEEAYSIQQTGDGGYIVAGSTDSYGAGKRDLLVLKLSSNGDTDPACGFVRESNAEVTDTSISPSNTDIIPQDTTISPQDTTISPQDSDALVYSLCSGQHTLSLSAGSGGTTVPQPGTYIYDHAVRIGLTADPDDGYNFSEWSGDVSGTDSWLSITMDSDKSINANFSIIVIDDVWEEVKKSPCFIATAAYGSPLHPYVRILREFRDKYLMSNKLGRSLVRQYYKYSPFVANLIAKHKVLKLIVQVNLLSLVIFSYSMVNFGPIATGGILLLIIMIPIFPYFRKFRG